MNNESSCAVTASTSWRIPTEDGETTNQEESIADMVAKAASEFMTEQFLPGYSFVEEYGLYYSQESGYYYDMKTDLFFHPSTPQCYYRFNSETQAYDVVQKQPSQKWHRKRHKTRATKIFGEEKSNELAQEEVEILELLFELGDKCSFLAGEEKAHKKLAKKRRHLEAVRAEYFDEELAQFCRPSGHIITPSTSSFANGRNGFSLVESSSSDEGESAFSPFFHMENAHRLAEEEMASQPSCIRLIQRHWESGDVQMHIVTITGATVGVGAHAAIKLLGVKWSGDLFDDIVFSINYIYTAASSEDDPVLSGFYELTVDASAQFLVLVNDEQIKPGEKAVVEHGAIVKVASNFFEFHIHRGLNTCQGCEPGIIAQPEKNVETVKLPKRSREAERKRQMRLIKEQYGLDQWDDTKDLSDKYIDRAAKRRMEELVSGVDTGAKINSVGGIYSHCKATPVPGTSTESVKLHIEQQQQRHPSSTSVHIAESDPGNRGASLLKKMGWSVGQGLGKHGQGIQQPIEAASKTDRKGLGTENTNNKISIKLKPSAREQILEKTRQRFDESSNVKGQK